MQSVSNSGISAVSDMAGLTDLRAHAACCRDDYAVRQARRRIALKHQVRLICCGCAVACS